MLVELRRINIFAWVLLMGLFAIFGCNGNWLASSYWLLQAGVVWAFAYRFCGQRSELNRAGPHTPLYPDLGWGNRLTLLRGGLIALTAGFIGHTDTISSGIYLAAGCYTAAAALDRVDGFVARRSGQVSLLGIELDIAFDALGLVVAPLLAIALGKLHGSYLLLSFAYYIYQWGLAQRRKQGLVIYPTVPNMLRRSLAGFQMGFIALILWPLVSPPVARITGVAFMIPVLAGFMLDWLVVCGYIKPQERGAAQFFNWLQKFSLTVLQPTLRLLAIATLLLVINNSHSTFFAGVNNFSIPLQALLLFAVLFIFFGFLGRVGALLLLLALGWQYPGSEIDSTGCLLLISLSAIALLGTGRFSVWQWDDKWVNRYDGAG